MLYERQKYLLSLLDALGGEIGALDFQKLLFRYCKDVEKTPSYDFVPYRFGGFSFTSYADKRRLVEKGLLLDLYRTWKLTPLARDSDKVDSKIRLGMDYFARKTGTLRGDELVAEAYRKHPYYAIRSEMAERVLAGDDRALEAIEAARPNPGRPGLFTIGYEGSTLENFLNRLILKDVSILCDVRRNPLSRKYGFSKGTLSNACESIGIQYEHFPQLGIASEDRRELNTQGDYDALFEVYERDYLPKQAETLATIQKWIDEGERVALTCFEKNSHQCHRQRVAKALECTGEGHLKTLHL